MRAVKQGMQFRGRCTLAPYVMCSMLCPPACGIGLLLGRLIFVIMFTLSYSIKLHKQADISDNGVGVAPFQLALEPPRLTHLLIHDFNDVHINCSTYGAHPDYSMTANASVFYGGFNTTITPDVHTTSQNDIPTKSSAYHYHYVASITTENPLIAIPVESDHIVKPLLFSNRTDQIYIPIYVNGLNMFSVYGLHVGHVALLVQVYEHADAVSLEEQLEYTVNAPQSSWELHDKTVAILEYRVSVVREVRLVDVVFECVIAVVTTLNAFSMGLSTDWPSLRHHIRHPSALVIGLFCQFVMMPVMTVGAAKALALPNNQRLGLFFISCVPGGGLGHIVVALIKGDRALSIALNCFNTIMAVGTTPLWIFCLGRFLGNLDHLLLVMCDFEIWLGASALAYMIGILLNKFRPAVAEAILNWLVKPFLLLFILVFGTIGVYINMYMFHQTDPRVPVAAALLPFFGYLFGLLIAYLSRQEEEYMKTLCTESSMFNCLLVLVMVRFSLPQPDADLCSAVAIWVLILTPLPFLCMAVVQSFRRCISDRCAKRRDAKYRHFSIVSSLLNVTNVTNLSSSITPKMSSPAEDSTVLIDEKVTVL